MSTQKKRVVIVGGGSTKLWPDMTVFKQKDCHWIGVDRGALFLMQYGIKPDLAIGDFDSLDEEEKMKMVQCISKIIYAQPEKEDTDTELALQEAMALYPDSEFILIGMTGGRIDHFLSNLWLPLQKRFSMVTENLILLDSQNTIKYYLPGSHQIRKEVGKKYVSFICLLPVEKLSLVGVKYPLLHQNYTRAISLVSNEFLSDSATFSFDKGLVAVIQSKDK